jgi:hypothetical protein
LVLARQRPEPVDSATRIRTVEESAHLRVEVRIKHADIIPARRDAQANAQLALYEFVKGDNAGARKGTRLDVCA